MMLVRLCAAYKGRIVRSVLYILPDGLNRVGLRRREVFNLLVCGETEL